MDVLFTVDIRSPTTAHVRHLWQVAFTVISGIKMDSGLVRVTFVPEAPTGRRPGRGQLPPIWGQQVNFTAFANHHYRYYYFCYLLLLLPILYYLRLTAVFVQVNLGQP